MRLKEPTQEKLIGFFFALVPSDCHKCINMSILTHAQDPRTQSCPLPKLTLCRARWWAFFWRGQGASTAECFRICPHSSFFPSLTLSPGMLQIPTAWFSLTYILVVELLSHVQLCASPCLQPASLPGPWDSPGKNTGASGHSLLQRIFPTRS